MKNNLLKVLCAAGMLCVVSGVALASSHGGAREQKGMGPAHSGDAHQQQMMQQKQHQKKEMKSKGEGNAKEEMKETKREGVKE